MAVWQVPIILLPLDDFYVEDDEYIFKENFIISSVSIEELRRVLKEKVGVIIQSNMEIWKIPILNFIMKIKN